MAAIDEQRKRVGAVWFRSIIVAIVVVGAFLVVMLMTQPANSWGWSMMLVIYIPFIVFGAGVLKFLLISLRKLKRRV